MTVTTFLGGPLDGRVVDYRILSPSIFVKCAVTHNLDVHRYAWRAKDEQPIIMQNVEYRLYTLLGHRFMVESKLADRGQYMGIHDFLIDQLRQGYRRPNALGDV